MSESYQIPEIAIPPSSERSESSAPKPVWKWTTGQLAIKAALTFYSELAATVRAANSGRSFDDSDSDSDDVDLQRATKALQRLKAGSARAESKCSSTTDEPPTEPDRGGETETRQTEGELTTAEFLAHVLQPWKKSPGHTVERDPQVIRKQLLEWTNDAQAFLRRHQQASQQSQVTESSAQDAKDCFRFVSEMNTMVKSDDFDFWDEVRETASFIKDCSARDRTDNALAAFCSATGSLSYFSFCEVWEGAPLVFQALHSIHDWYFAEKELDPSKQEDVIESLKRLQEYEDTLRSRLRSGRSGDDSKPNRQERRRMARSQRT